ncbi:4-(cytidine 5'-diphospho)-2-C-methyl-D-erythritol kinase [Hyphobacterium marinum]|uniref:4-diphosphocytidyl-2-C-methyl-D-erythritol kinase n=1 Tax=Hyphobacterium marinum TaxID=3116574 RepID=A0ABU7M0Z2_9PROT|nr:4-(cytidine 5'-diphospho)-2-C-methyl-D-erythritol kinase [Hyphobacterium sp. Y6023]MEE2567476.1 4-(cytidine 5'-diphospho)-2-C-methyl-D-erythritol kinase [Hyphobacterium sp. Y6023]
MISQFAPAKVNLTLHAGPVRDDGYHPLDSLVVFADWGDHLAAVASDKLELTLSGEGAEQLEAEGNNLVLRAAEALRKAARLPVFAGAKLHLTKAIPMGAGLGGGSSDAAATLRALNRLWHLDWPLDRLIPVAAEIGSDVPACLHARPLRMTGRGEIIEALKVWPVLDAVLCLPGLQVPTGKVFAAFDTGEPTALPPPGDLPSAKTAKDALAVAAAGRNDLERAAISVEPRIGNVLAALNGAPAARLAGLSGSGSTCWALFDSRAQAKTAAEALAAAHPEWVFKPVRLAGTR